MHTLQTSEFRGQTFIRNSILLYIYNNILQNIVNHVYVITRLSNTFKSE